METNATDLHSMCHELIRYIRDIDYCIYSLVTSRLLDWIGVYLNEAFKDKSPVQTGKIFLFNNTDCRNSVSVY